MKPDEVPYPGLMFASATHWQMRSEEIRIIAEDVSDPDARAMMLRIAADYERLAENAPSQTPPRGQKPE